MNRKGCSMGDVTSPTYDPVHGVVHHFYLDNTDNGPVYGHFVSKDFAHWAPMPIAIFSGLDVATGKFTAYDSQAIYTGSASVVEGIGPGGVPGIVLIYPGICSKAHWPSCNTSGQMAPDNGVVLVQAVAADYSTDELLTNWTKPVSASAPHLSYSSDASEAAAQNYNPNPKP